MTSRNLSRKVRKGWNLVGSAVRCEWSQRFGSGTAAPASAVQAARQWLRILGAEPLPPVRGRILITATRNRTWIEWAAYGACVLRRLGFASTLLYRGSQIARYYTAPASFNFWHKVSAIPDIELIDLDTVAPDRSQLEVLRPMVEATAAASLAYDLHIEESDVHNEPARYGPRLRQSVEEWTRLGASFAVILRTRQFTRFLCLSGLIAETPALLAVARAQGLTTVCLEGWGWRPGHMIYNLNAPALEYNVTGWMRSLGEWDAHKEREVDAYFKFLDGEKHDADWLDNFYRIQRDTLSTDLPEELRRFLQGPAQVFLLAPNVIGDSSLLSRQTIFPGQQVWIAEVIRWFAARPQLKLIVRAHPGEQWAGDKCIISMAKVARAAAQNAPNIHVIDSDDPINTFSLVPFARAALAWVSNAGVDFVVRGLPTMVAARPKYSGLGIVDEPGSAEEYFRILERWTVAAERPSQERITRGKRYLHMVFKGFSFEAGGRNYRATGCTMDRMPNQAEHDRFYRILVGDEPMRDISPLEEA